MSEKKYDPIKDPYHPLKHLAAMRYADKDEIPAEVIHSNSPDNLRKVRGAWWSGVAGDMGIAIDEKMVTDEELKLSINEFIDKVEAMQFGDDTPASMRTVEEIAWANQFIDDVLKRTGYANVLLDLSSLKPETE